MQLFETGRAMTELAWDDQDDYAAELRTGAATEGLRAFARATWGDAWTADVLGF